MHFKLLLVATTAISLQTTVLTLDKHPETGDPIAYPANGTKHPEKMCFDKSFRFGTATAAYQVEGAFNIGQRQLSIWDSYCRAQNKSCGDIADDFYHRYKLDIQQMVEDGYENFRLSISWPRIMNFDPDKKCMIPNKEGIQFYHAVIDALKAANIEPMVTMYHWDLPQALFELLDKKGWINELIVLHFAEYARLLLTEFGDKVKYWITFNEINSFIQLGYYEAIHAPGLKDMDVYKGVANVLLSHAEAHAIFVELQGKDKIGKDVQFGIATSVQFSYPFDHLDKLDIEASKQSMEFEIALYLQPLKDGTFPERVKKIVGNRLPVFTETQIAKLKGSYNVIYLNYYTGNKVRLCSHPKSTTKCTDLQEGFKRDRGVQMDQDFRGSRKPSDSRCSWLIAYAPGIYQVFRYLMNFSDSKIPFHITEIGWCGENKINDENQLWYYKTHMIQIYKAMMQLNVPLQSVNYWSLLDNYEWGTFELRFGLYHVQYNDQILKTDSNYVPRENDLKRTQKIAGAWTAELAKTKCFVNDINDMPLFLDPGY